MAPHYYDRAPQPLQAFIDTVMLPFDFLSYPGRRDWSGGGAKFEEERALLVRDL